MTRPRGVATAGAVGAERQAARLRASRRALWATGLGALALFAVLLVALAPLEPGVLALQMAYTPRRFGAIVHQWSPAQLMLYRAHLPFDGLLLLLYGSFGWLLAAHTRVLAPLPRRLQRLAAPWLPTAALCDAIENLLHGWLTEAPRFGAAGLYLWASGCSLLKWFLLAGYALLVAAALWRDAPRAPQGDA